MILDKIDKAFLQHDNDLRIAMSNQSLKIDPWLITGIIEGDGHTDASLVIRKDMRIIQSRVVVGISVLTLNVIIIELVKYHLTCLIDSLEKMPFSYRSIAITENLGTGALDQRRGSVSSVRFQSNYVFSRVFVPFLKNYPLQTIKYTRINMCYKSWKNYKRGALKDVENAILLLRPPYIGASGSGDAGRGRRRFARHRRPGHVSPSGAPPKGSPINIFSRFILL